MSKLRWTSDPPTEEGWWWCQWPSGLRECGLVARVQGPGYGGLVFRSVNETESDGSLVEWCDPPATPDTLWAGPIQPPPRLAIAHQAECGIKTLSTLNNRKHWRSVSAARKKERQAGRDMMLGHGIKLPLTRRLVVTFCRLSAGSLDDDNLAAAGKSIRDGVADALEIDDANDLVEWVYTQERAKRGVYGVRVLIEEEVT